MFPPLPPRTRALGSRKGFTLLELLTTLTILGVVATAVAASFGTSVRLRRAMRAQVDGLQEMQTLSRLVHEDLAHLVPVPHALRVEGESLLLLRTSPAASVPAALEAERLSIVRYRRDPTPEGEGPLLREVHEVDVRVLMAWSEESLGEGPGAALRPFGSAEVAAPVFRLDCPVEWKLLEYGDGEWYVPDADDHSAVRAVGLWVGSAVDPPGDAPNSRGRDCEPWTIRIPLHMRLVEEAGS